MKILFYDMSFSLIRYSASFAGITASTTARSNYLQPIFSMNNVFNLKSACSYASVLTLLGLHGVQAQTITASTVTANQSGTNGQFVLTLGNDSNPYIHMFGKENTNGAGGSLNFIAGYSSDVNRPVFTFQVRDANTNANWQHRLQILQSGQVRIGGTASNIPTPTTQADYKLAVAGKIVAQSIYVTNPNNWADFVFEPTYKVMPLPDLETYLLRNKHLPAIPAASEVTKVGYSLPEMDAKLLQTIEELTLQVIELGKQNKSLQQMQQQTKQELYILRKHLKPDASSVSKKR